MKANPRTKTAKTLLAAAAALSLATASATHADVVVEYNLTRLGLTGTGYQRTSDGFEASVAQFLNEQGQAVGYSQRYNGTANTGRAIWLDDGNGPTRLGLTGTGYQRTSDGFEASFAQFLNEQGQAVGYSQRYNGTSYTGLAAWLDDGSGPTRLGLTGTGYQRTSDGFEASFAQFLNEQGQAVGTSDRYNGTTYTGRAGWFYDSLTDTLSELVFSVRDDGYAYTTIGALLEDGTVFGVFNEFDGATDLGRSVFAWDMTEGFVDLGELAVSTDGETWDDFYNVITASEFGYVIGNGLIDGQTGQSAFLFTRVPEPSSLALLAIGGLGLLRRRRSA